MTETLYQTTVTDPVDREERQLAQKIIDAIERPKQGSASDDAPGGFLPTMALPGFGDSYDNCGDEIPHFCEDCGHTFTVGRTCRRSVCPRCAPAWVVDRATSIVGKLDATARMMSADRGGEAVFKHHLAFMPDPEDWYLQAEDPVEKTIEVIKEILEIMDAEGVIFYHPWSGSEEHEDDRGEWKKRLFSDRDWEDDVRPELMPRGHFHAVVASPFIPGGEVINLQHQATDWVIRRITKRDGSGHSLSNLQDVARAASYSLSHTGIRHTERTTKNNQAMYRYVGSTINNAEVYDDIEAEASKAVREVAPKVLGIPSQSVRCGREIDTSLPGNAGDDFSQLWDFDASAEPGAGDDGSTSSTSTGTTDDADDFDPTETRQCSGRIRPIDDAPDFLDDPEWVARAAKADELQTTWDEWAGKSWPD